MVSALGTVPWYPVAVLNCCGLYVSRCHSLLSCLPPTLVPCHLIMLSSTARLIPHAGDFGWAVLELD